MINIFGIPVGNVNQEHLKYVMRTFADKEKTKTHVKELQSTMAFLTKFKETEKVGREWRDLYAKKVNISVVIGTCKYLSKKLSIPLHRVCKTSYPLNVYISHYYAQLKPYLETFQYTKVTKDVEIPTFNDPFNWAKEYIIRNGSTKNNIYYASLILASSLSKKENLKVEHVVYLKETNGLPIFIPFKRENGKVLPIIEEKTKVEEKKRVIFPSILEVVEETLFLGSRVPQKKPRIIVINS